MLEYQVKKETVNKDGNRQSRQGSQNIVPEPHIGHRQSVIQRRHGLKDHAQRGDGKNRSIIQLIENFAGQFVVETAQCVASRMNGTAL